jgi:hypothetical protein
LATQKNPTAIKATATIFVLFINTVVELTVSVALSFGALKVKIDYADTSLSIFYPALTFQFCFDSKK